MKFRHGMLGIMSVLMIVTLMSAGAVAAADLVKQVMAPDGKALMITGWNESTSVVFEGYDVDLRVFTPEFSGTVSVPGKSTTIAVVRGGKVDSLLKMQGTQLPVAPAIPDDGYLLVGSGMGERFLSFIMVGDQLTFREKVRKTPSPLPTAVIALSGGSKELSAVNRGRSAMELILYTPDFGSHTFTNQYGAEIAVVDSAIVARRNYNSTDLMPIPENGYVLSGHNVMGSWLDNLKPDDLLELQ